MACVHQTHVHRCMNVNSQGARADPANPGLHTTSASGRGERLRGGWRAPAPLGRREQERLGPLRGLETGSKLEWEDPGGLPQEGRTPGREGILDPARGRRCSSGLREPPEEQALGSIPPCLPMLDAASPAGPSPSPLPLTVRWWRVTQDAGPGASPAHASPAPPSSPAQLCSGPSPLQL